MPEIQETISAGYKKAFAIQNNSVLLKFINSSNLLVVMSKNAITQTIPIVCKAVLVLPQLFAETLVNCPIFNILTASTITSRKKNRATIQKLSTSKCDNPNKNMFITNLSAIGSNISPNLVMLL